MIKYYWQFGVLFGLVLLQSPSLSQTRLENLQQVQFLSQNECVIVQINADWNISASIDLDALGTLKNCNWFNASIDDADYGSIIAEEWKVKSVPTIIMFEYGKEIKRFEAGLSFQLDEENIIRLINKEIDKIMLRRFE
tara:strand:+ start:194 stop:607 length:414 start_codon:yes stop_codon:yes gene_type:complete